MYDIGRAVWTKAGSQGSLLSDVTRMETADARHREGSMRLVMVAVLTWLYTASTVQAQSPSRVTPDNFVRAETDMYFGNFVRDSGLGRFKHTREPASIDHQTVIRLNRDTLYSSAVFDLDAGPVTVTLPDAGNRFRSMQVIDQDHYTHGVIYAPGAKTFERQAIGTRYIALLVRTLLDPNDPEDLKKVHALQDQISVAQKSPGMFEVPGWDQASQKKVRDALLVLASNMKNFDRAFGAKDQVDPIHRLIGTAAGWGGNPDKDATYVGYTPSKNDGATVYKLTVMNNVPVDGFWSISVYNAEGYFEKNSQKAYTINNLTAKKETDGSVKVQFGGCNNNLPNCLPTTKGWNYLVRLYRPRPEILTGQWRFPEAQPEQ